MVQREDTFITTGRSPGRCCPQVSESPLSPCPQRTSNVLVASSHHSGNAICWGWFVSCTLSICPALQLSLQVYRLLSQMSLAQLGRMTGWRLLWASLIPRHLGPAHIFKALMLPGNSPSSQARVAGRGIFGLLFRPPEGIPLNPFGTKDHHFIFRYNPGL